MNRKPETRTQNQETRKVSLKTLTKKPETVSLKPDPEVFRIRKAENIIRKTEKGFRFVLEIHDHRRGAGEGHAGRGCQYSTETVASQEC